MKNNSTHSTKTPASFLARFVAELLDFLLYWSVVAAGLWWLTSDVSRMSSGTLWLQMTIGFFIPSIFIQMWYIPFLTARYGGSVGKLLNGLMVLDTSTHGFLTLERSFFRQHIAKAVSIMPLYLGILSRLKHPRHQTWHDELAGTEVVTTATGNDKVGVGAALVLGLLVLEGWLWYSIATAILATLST